MTKCLVLLTMLAVASHVTAQTNQTPPTTAYLEFMAVAQKATSFEHIAPYLSDALKKALSTKDAQAGMFKYFKITIDLVDLKVTKETVTGDGCVLLATAKDKAGKPASGKIDLVREKGQWKFDDHGWVGAP